MLTWTAAALMLVAVVGGTVTIPSNNAAASATGLAAGFFLPFFAAIGPWLTRRAGARR